MQAKSRNTKEIEIPLVRKVGESAEKQKGVSQVYVEFLGVEEAAQRAQDAIEKLEDRISDILTPIPENETIGQDVQKQELVPMAKRLRDLGCRIDLLANNIKRIEARVQL